MPSLTAESAEQILRACGDNLELLAESLNHCFDRSWQVEVGDAVDWNASTLAGEERQPGLVVLFEFDGHAAACLVPAAIGLPAWHRTPDNGQRGRLETLALEWSLNMFPSDLAATRSTTRTVDDLALFVVESVPDGTASTLELHAVAQGERCGTLRLVWPLTLAASDAETPVIPTPAPAPHPVAPPVTPLPARGSNVLARFRGMPVQISVRLAEKRIPVSQLLGITPGALITFNKPCEDLLDLYVNNALYCRGEAVKIGESFGLKVNQVGAVPPRVTKILNG